MLAKLTGRTHAPLEAFCGRWPAFHAIVGWRSVLLFSKLVKGIVGAVSRYHIFVDLTGRRQPAVSYCSVNEIPGRGLDLRLAIHAPGCERYRFGLKLVCLNVPNRPTRMRTSGGVAGE